MKTFKPWPWQDYVVIGFAGILWPGLALIILSPVVRAMDGTLTSGARFVITAGCACGAAVGGWYTSSLLKWLAGTVRSRDPRSRP